MAKKEFSIPDCPQLSKYDGMGSAGANMMYHDRVARERHRPGDYSTEISTTTETITYNGSNAYDKGFMDGCKFGYTMGYTHGYEDCKGNYEPDDFVFENYVYLSKSEKEKIIDKITYVLSLDR